MATTLDGARKSALKSRLSTPVEVVSPGDFVTWLSRGESHHYIPHVARVVRELPSGNIRINVYADGKTFRVVSKRALITDPACAEYKERYDRTGSFRGNGEIGTHYPVGDRLYACRMWGPKPVNAYSRFELCLNEGDEYTPLNIWFDYEPQLEDIERALSVAPVARRTE